MVWATVILFAEYYTAINLLGEPFYLAAIEVSLFTIPFIGEGRVSAGIIGRRLWNKN